MSNDELREQMLEGEDTPVSEREPHRGEAAGIDGGPADTVQGGAGMAGGGSGGSPGAFGTGADQVTMSGSGSPYGEGDQRGEDTPGAFGEESGDDTLMDTGDGPRDNALKKLQGT